MTEIEEQQLNAAVSKMLWAQTWNGIVVTPEIEAAAQMRTMVWLEARSDAGLYKAVNPLRGTYCDTWYHPDVVSVRGDPVPQDAPRHRAIPKSVLVVAWNGFDPRNQTTYADLVSLWCQL